MRRRGLASAYVPRWRRLLDAVKHVARVRGVSEREAVQELVPALRDGAIKARYYGGGFLGGDGQIAPETRYRARSVSLDDGAVEFYPHPLSAPPSPWERAVQVWQVEVWWDDVLEWFPEANPSATALTSDRQRRGKPGPKPKKRLQIGKKMLDDLLSAKRTSEELKSDTLEALAKEYGGSRNWAKAARDDALEQFATIQKLNSEQR
jgi:hypothetical protein